MVQTVRIFYDNVGRRVYLERLGLLLYLAFLGFDWLQGSVRPNYALCYMAAVLEIF